MAIQLVAPHCRRLTLAHCRQTGSSTPRWPGQIEGMGPSLILIVPRWPGNHWLAEIFQPLSSPPWPLPRRGDLRFQAVGRIFHPHPQRIDLNSVGAPRSVIDTIQCGWASSTMTLYEHEAQSHTLSVVSVRWQWTQYTYSHEVKSKSTLVV